MTWVAGRRRRRDAGGRRVTGALAPVRAVAVAAGGAVVEAARAGDAMSALRALGSFRMLCAHRRGPHGVARLDDAGGALAGGGDRGLRRRRARLRRPTPARDPQRLRARALQRRHRRGRRDRRGPPERRVRARRRARLVHADPPRRRRDRLRDDDPQEPGLPVRHRRRACCPTRGHGSSPASCSTRRLRARASG